MREALMPLQVSPLATCRHRLIIEEFQAGPLPEWIERRPLPERAKWRMLNWFENRLFDFIDCPEEACDIPRTWFARL